MSNIKKISALLFLLAQMCVAFAGNPTDPSDRTYVGFWLVRQANDEIKQVKFAEMPASIMFEGTENVNEPMVRQLLGYETMDTFEGAAVEESLFMVMSFDSGEKVDIFDSVENYTFIDWCYDPYWPWNPCKKAGQCVQGAKICKGGNGSCWPASMQMYCAGNGN